MCNSEAESVSSDPEYQNISNVKYRSVPTPKPRTKYIEVSERNQSKLLKSISEIDNDVQKSNRSPGFKNKHESILSRNRTLSEREKEPQTIRNKVYDSPSKRLVLTFVLHHLVSYFSTK